MIVWILGDQLTPRMSGLQGLSPSDCRILMIESLASARQRPYHKQKLTLVWSAMRHFAEELRTLGYEVDYYELQPDFKTALKKCVASARPAAIRLMETSQYHGTRRLQGLIRECGVNADVTPNNMFLSDRDEFARAAAGRKTLIMETFYRKMRRKTGLLMRDGDPAGGEWNYDRLNRQRPPKGHEFPAVPRFEPDKVTREIMRFVQREFPDHFGDIDGFAFPVTRKQAEIFLADFLNHRLDEFGPYEDAIVRGEPHLYHSLLSPLLNIGLLEPLDVCRQAEARYLKQQARLNSVEGFIRQIIGWREFIYQVYWLQMPAYVHGNHLKASLPLPDFYWTGETRMECVRDAVQNLRRWGINHHIQRLMVTGNFALIAGIDPQKVNDWYWLAYTDAYEWVVAPNVLGLSLYADGGVLATKPYAASANYLNKMSDCCHHCEFDHRTAVGPAACPFNSLYWDFLARNSQSFAKNPRMNMVMATLKKRGPKWIQEIRSHAKEIRHKLADGVKL